jgi:hypothetical protein
MRACACFPREVVSNCSSKFTCCPAPDVFFCVQQVLGHFKLLLILACGVAFFGEDTNPLRLLGMAVAFGGIVAYTTLKQNMANEWGAEAPREQKTLKEAAEEAALMQSQGDDEEGGH